MTIDGRITTDGRIRVTELDHARNDRRSAKEPATVRYFDHQPGDATRYEILAVDLQGKGLHLGRLGYVNKDGVVVVCGMGDGRAWLFQRGQQVSEFYVKDAYGLTNEHTVHHITELVAKAIDGQVVGCTHETDPA